MDGNWDHSPAGSGLTSHGIGISSGLMDQGSGCGIGTESWHALESRNINYLGTKIGIGNEKTPRYHPVIG